MLFLFDTETYPIREALIAPKLVCLQYAFDDGEIHIVEDKQQIHDVLNQVLDNEDCLLVAHYAQYDFVVLARAFPDLVPKIFAALSAGRGRDTRLQAQLLAIRDGTLQKFNNKFGLKDQAAKYGMVIEKEDVPRMDYALVDGTHPSSWPESFITYARKDIEALRFLKKNLDTVYKPPDESLHVAAAFALQLAANYGMRIDQDTLNESINYFQNEQNTRGLVLTESGVLKPDGKLNNKQIATIIRDVCSSIGILPNMTDKGAVKTDAETCEELKDYHPVLANLSQFKTAQKMNSTYLSSFEIGTRYAMPTSPNVLVATGRTSWGGHSIAPYNPFHGIPPSKIKQTSGTNLQNLPRAPGIRECFVPRKGHYFCSVDYNSLELRTLGQVCLWLIGRSTFASGYQKDSNWDPHTYFGGQLLGITYDKALELKATDKSFKKGPRQVGKTANFSLPGGVGANTLMGQINSLYKDGVIEKEYTLVECTEIKEKWLDAYPEMRSYFDIADYYSRSKTPADMPRTGRLRGGLSYTAAANNYFQGVASDLAKRALFAVTQACYCEPTSPLYQSRVVAFIHDEILLEVPEDRAHEAAFETVRLMVREASIVCPDVPFEAEPALCERWDKNMEPVFENGRLVPWKK